MNADSRDSDRKLLERLVQHLRPSDKDPTYLVLKAHLVAEEVLTDFLMRQAPNSRRIGEARLNFSQLLSLSRAFHRLRDDDWWVWASLKKLNSLRNLLAHNLKPTDLTERIVDFSVFVADAIGATSESEIGRAYEKLAMTGVHPFVLALVALHMSLSTSLGLDPEDTWKPVEGLH
jgi:hypothetical protein